MDYKYKEGQKIYFNLGNGVKGWGVIRGASTIISQDYPIWIVQFSPPAPVDSKLYPFTAWLFFDNQISTEEFELKDQETDDSTVTTDPQSDSAPV